MRSLNPKVAASVEGAAVSFPTEATALRRVGSRPLVAGVSSFGYSGTIAHVLLEEAPALRARPLPGSGSVQPRV